jgi:hypothetical protein
MVPALPEKARERVKVRAGAKKETKQTGITLNPDKVKALDKPGVQEKAEVQEKTEVQEKYNIPETGKTKIKTDISKDIQNE